MPADVLPGAEPFTFDAPGPVGALLLHGFTGCPQSLRPWGGALRAAGIGVHCPLLPGHGTSWTDLARSRSADWSRAARAGFELVAGRYERVFVGALSFGAALALELAAREPGRVRGLVLVNPYLYSTERGIGMVGLLKWVVPTVPGVGSDVADPTRHELAYERVPLRAVDQSRRLQAAVIAGLSSVRQPLQLFVSRQDHVVDPGNARLVADKVASQQVEVVWLERSFHVATLDYDAPEIFARSVRFMTQLS